MNKTLPTDHSSVMDARHLPGDGHRDIVRPTTFDGYIGQDKVLNPLKVFVSAAIKRSAPLDHLLLYGPPGLGKTTLSRIIAHEMQSQLHQTSGPVIEKPGDLAALLTNLNHNDVLFIDEIHRLSASAEEILYSAMEENKLDIMLGEGPAARSVKIDIAPFTLIAATTRAGMLTSPLRDRFGMVYHLIYYDLDALTKILNQSAQQMGIRMTQEALKALATRSRGTPRIANRLLRRVRDCLLVSDAQIADIEIVNHAMRLLDIDASGLEYIDRRYMGLLFRLEDKAAIGLDAIAATLGEDKMTIEDVVEPYLLLHEYIVRTPRGRALSDKGRAYCHTQQSQSGAQ